MGIIEYSIRKHVHVFLRHCLLQQTAPASPDIVYVGPQHEGQVLQSRDKLISFGDMFTSEVMDQPHDQLTTTKTKTEMMC